MRIELKDVIKSRDVEDPVNLHVHRPLQLLLVRPLLKTSITPNQVTFLSLCAGLGSAALIVKGTPLALVAAGGLLFSSAILDGVDGMIARTKKLSSETGHAIDGAADYAVNVSTTLAAIYYLAQRMNPLLALGLGLVAHLAWAQHLMLYDFHCATYLRFLTGGKHQGGDLDRGKALLQKMKDRGDSFFSVTLVSIYVWQLGNRQNFLEKVNPIAASYRTMEADRDTGAAYVARHRATMRAWAFLGNAPHMDLMALATVTGRFDLYFLLRIVGFTTLAVVLAFWERRVSAVPLDSEGQASAA
jgi:phosphatidylglycerophosphate synthase